MNQTGRAYGRGLYLLAKEEGLEDTVLQQIQSLQTAFSQEPAFTKLLASSNIPKAERLQILEESFRDQVHLYVLNFLKILTEKGYIRHFPACMEAYQEQYNEDKGILEVRVDSAAELTCEQKNRLTDKLAAITGKKICLVCRVDPAVLGGVRLRYAGTQVDGTVQGRLEMMKKSLKNTVL